MPLMPLMIDSSVMISRSLRTLGTILVASAVVATGCSSTKGQAEECEESSECAEGARCVDVANGKACTGPLDAKDAFSTECGEGGANGCAGLRCLVLEENLEGKAGICSAPCTGDVECSNGACLDFEGQKLCFAVCTSDGDCQNGFTCVDNGDGRSICLVHTGKRLSPCTEDAECQDGTATCVETGNAGKRCTGDLADPKAFETECTVPDDCVGLVCITLVDNEEGKSGICSAHCATDADCPKGRCVSSKIGDYCYSSCTSDDDCSSGFSCIPAQAGSDEKVCAVTPK